MRGNARFNKCQRVAPTWMYENICSAHRHGWRAAARSLAFQHIYTQSGRALKNDGHPAMAYLGRAVGKTTLGPRRNTAARFARRLHIKREEKRSLQVNTRMQVTPKAVNVMLFVKFIGTH
jgi:hypothetical protein